MYVNDTQTERERESKMSTHKQNKETKTSNETEQTRWVGGRKKRVHTRRCDEMKQVKRQV